MGNWIWDSPYMDNKGNYHEASFVRIVDAESKWEKVAEISDFDTKPVANIRDSMPQENSVSKSTAATLTESNDEDQEGPGGEEDNQELDDVKEINLNQPVKQPNQATK